MKLYGKKFLGNRIRQAAADRIESRDAILWDVQSDQRVARVKVQGSNEYIVAHFPQSWENIPGWLKPGNSVRVAHVGGIRGKIEIVGTGQTVPTPVAGGASPALDTPIDTVLSGCRVTAQDSGSAWWVDVGSGTYRINGMTYDLDAQEVELDPPNGAYRYDLIYVGTDGTAHVQKGTPSIGEPTMPLPPGDTVALGYALVFNGQDEISSIWMNVPWTTPIPRVAAIDSADPVMAWDQTQSNVTVCAQDQYGNAITNRTFYVTLEIIYGSGSLHSNEEGDGQKVGGHTALGCYTFTYTRLVTLADNSPVFRAEIYDENNQLLLMNYSGITLQDEDGNTMGPPVPGGYSPFSIFAEYPGALMSASGSNNDPGTYGMTSDFEAVSNTIYNYYQWKSSISSGLQSYDINVKIPIPADFTGLRQASNTSLTVQIKTEENTTTNNKIDIILEKDGNATTSSLTNQKSSVAATWETIGFASSDTVLASLAAGNVLNVTIRLYSQNSKYARVGKIGIEMMRSF